MNNIHTMPFSKENIPVMSFQGVPEFYDLPSCFKNPEWYKDINDAIYHLFEEYKGVPNVKVVGAEARWFILGAVLADRLNAWFVLARKPWKMPGEVYEAKYHKEYGDDIIQMQRDAIKEDDTVIVIDDILATWGTSSAIYELVKKFNPKKIIIFNYAQIEALKWKGNLIKGGVPEEDIKHIMGL